MASMIQVSDTQINEVAERLSSNNKDSWKELLVTGEKKANDSLCIIL
jgi:hypothetical protein